MTIAPSQGVFPLDRTEEGVRTILIIDDYQPLLKLYERELKKEGYRLLAAHDVEEASQRAQAVAIDLAIVEVECMRLEEFEVLAQDLVKSKGVPIVINTGGLSGSHARYRGQPIAAWIAKSSNLDPLKECIRVLMRR
jgi:DNA-binding response OmpR family regulator